MTILGWEPLKQAVVANWEVTIFPFVVENSAWVYVGSLVFLFFIFIWRWRKYSTEIRGYQKLVVVMDRNNEKCKTEGLSHEGQNLLLMKHMRKMKRKHKKQRKSLEDQLKRVREAEKEAIGIIRLYRERQLLADQIVALSAEHEPLIRGLLDRVGKLEENQASPLEGLQEGESRGVVTSEQTSLETKSKLVSK